MGQSRNVTPRVAVLCGGPSGEREISLLSGAGVHAALRSVGYNSVKVEITAAGEWLEGTAARSVGAAVDWLRREFDVVFPALHGPFGEDGVLQGLLDASGMRYVGSSVAASALAMDKLLCRRIASTLSIRVADAVEVGPLPAGADLAATIGEVRRLPPPWFVKPNASGSSVGVTRVERAEELRPAIARALAEGSRAVIEAAVVGTEISCPVLGDAFVDSRALPVIEIVPRAHDFFDYQAKYTAGHTDEICPARLPAPVAAAAQAAAQRLHDMLGCRDLSRSDFIVTPQGELVFLELNTLPGLTEMSLYPKAAAAVGMTYAELVRTLVDRALRRVAG